NNKLYATRDLPVKTYYLGPVFRYERPQSGRYRQFHQFGVESLGVKNVLSDVETAILGYVILSALGLENVTLKINTLGDKASRDNYRQALKDYFAPKLEKMCDDCKVRYDVNPLRILDCKVPEDHALVLKAPKIEDYLSKETKDKFYEVVDILKETDVPFEIDSTLVRGLDYYSEFVYEYHYTSKKGVDYGALGAGGHYDDLIEELGGPRLSGVGFSFGIERIYAVLKDDGIFQDHKEAIDLYVMPLDEEARESAFYLANVLRTAGYKTEINLSDTKIGAMFKKAEKIGAKFALIIGENEINNKTVILKDLKTKEQEEVDLKVLLEKIDKNFGENSECSCHHQDEEGSCHCHHDDEGE
ncbi:MAG: histidine--tRNA ligase, partial [Bacilli bacterium]